MTAIPSTCLDPWTSHGIRDMNARPIIPARAAQIPAGFFVVGSCAYNPFYDQPPGVKTESPASRAWRLEKKRKKP